MDSIAYYAAAIPALFIDQIVLAAIVWIVVPILGFKGNDDPHQLPLNDMAAKHVAMFPYPAVRCITAHWIGIVLATIALGIWVWLRVSIALAIAGL